MMARSKKWMTLGAGLLLPVVAWAQTSDGSASMIQGGEAIRQIFGADPTSLASLIGGGEAPTILSVISTVLNTAAALFAVAIALITFFTGTLQQAHEGVVLGRRYSSLWVPLRIVLAFFYLTPLPSGYSILQMLILWIGMSGSNICDMAWNKTVTYMQNNASVVGVPVLPSTRDLVSKMYESAVCAKRLNNLAQADGQSPSVTTNMRSPQTYQEAPKVSAQYSTTGGVIGALGGNPSMAIQYEVTQAEPDLLSGVSYDANGSAGGSLPVGGLCGAYMIDRKALSIPDNETAILQQQNLQTLATTLDGIASDAIDSHLSMENVRYRLISAEALYSAGERDRAVTYVARTADTITQKRVSQLAFSQSAGWTSAGAWYMTFSALADTLMQQIAVAPTYHGPRYDQMSTSAQVDIRPDIQRAQVLTKPGLLNPSAAMSSSLPSQMSGSGTEIDIPAASDNVVINIDNWAGKEWQSTLDSVNAVLTDKNPVTMMIQALGSSGGRDPIVALSGVGHGVLKVAEGAMGVGLGLGVLSTAVFDTAIATVSPFLIGGAVLAYYLPMLPYIYWMFGVASWLLMLLEALALASLWSAAHVLPEGEGWAGQHARQGYIMIVSLLARPVLMLFGLLGAMLLMRYLSLLVGVTFKYAMDATQGDKMMGLASMISYFVILMGLYVGIARVCFSLIHVLPDRGLRFIGGGESLGDLGGERHTHGGAMLLAGAVVAQISRMRGTKKPPNSGSSEAGANRLQR